MGHMLEISLCGSVGVRALCGALAVVLASGMAGCTTPQPPKIIAIGTMPTGPMARFTLIDNSAGEAWLASHQVVNCLESQGMHADDNATYIAQYAVAVRPEKINVVAGAKADAAQPPIDEASLRPRGEHILYSLSLDRLSDGVRVYEIKIDAKYRTKRSTQTSRAAEFCSGVQHKPS